MPGNGIMSVQSHFSAKETIERLLATLTEKHLTVFRACRSCCGRGLHRLVIANNRTGDFW